MRIAVPIDHLRAGKGGLEAWLFALARHLVAAGDEVVAVTMDAEPPGPPFRHHRLAPRGWTRAGRDLDFARRARDFCRRPEFDVVLGLRHVLACDVYAPHGGAVAATLAAHRRAKRFPSLPSAKHRAFLAMERELLAGPKPPRVVLAVSEMVRQDLAARFPGIAGRIRVVPNGVDLDRFTPDGREEARRSLGLAGEPALLFLAGNPRLKGWPAARRIFEVVRREEPAAVLLVAGGRPGRLPPGARYLGPLADPRPALKAADVLLQPTWYDPFPLTTLEALACGTPVATTRRNGAVDHLGADGPVRAADSPEDVDALAAATLALLRTAPRAAARALATRHPESASLAAAAHALRQDISHN